MARTIKLMADYRCSPLWEPGSDTYNVAPEDLPIPDALRAALWAWAAAYDRTLNDEDPAASGFASTRESQAFEEEGRRLWQALRDALQPDFQVQFFSELEQQVLE